jgi:hypothetical protein
MYRIYESDLFDDYYVLETNYQDNDEVLIEEKPPLCKLEKLMVEINHPIVFNYVIPAPDI